MNERGQVFTGTVSGDIAGRDINNHHTTVLAPLPTESQLQSKFAQRTGIWCPKPAREWLEHLLDVHAFTVRELRASWKANSIGWSAEHNQRRINTPRLEAVFIHTIVWLALAASAEAVIRLFGDDARNSLWKMAATAGEVAFYMACFMQFTAQMLVPRRVALRVARVCAHCHCSGASPK